MNGTNTTNNNNVILQINRTTQQTEIDDKTTKILNEAANKTLNNAQVVQAIGVGVNEANNATFTIHLTLVGKTEMQTLNNNHRQINKPTDVLTFPLFDRQEATTEIRKLTQTTPQNNRTNIPLGDIVICTPVAFEQSQELCSTYTKELAFLLIHATLHLLGFDHIQDHHSNVMIPLQNKILHDLALD